MLGAHGLLQPNCSEDTACYFNSTLESRKEIEKFVSKLQHKNLRPRQVNGKTFFGSPFELFSAIFGGARGDAKRINRDLKNFILRFPSWKDLLPELAFLEIHQKVLLYFVSHPDMVILSGLALSLLSVMFKTPLKVHQMYQRKSLVSFEVAGGLEGVPKVQVAVFLFGDAISFCLLDKSKAVSPLPNMDDIIEGLRTNNAKFKADFSRIETEIMQTLVENMGPFSQLLLNFTDFTHRMQQTQHERDELVGILNSIRDDMSGRKQDTFASDKVLRIESLGLEGLSPAVKAELIFGKKLINEELNKASQALFILPDRPPGLKDRYSDSLPTFSMHTLDLFERVESINSPNNGNDALKRTPETGETINRKHSFEGMNTIHEHAEEHMALGQSGQSKQLKDLKRYGGVLKFVNEKGEFGFFLKDLDKSDVFFHFSELKQAGIPLKTLTDSKTAKVTFLEVEYTGKNNKKAKKAVDIQLEGQF